MADGGFSGRYRLRNGQIAKVTPRIGTGFHGACEDSLVKVDFDQDGNAIGTSEDGILWKRVTDNQWDIMAKIREGAGQ